MTKGDPKFTPGWALHSLSRQDLFWWIKKEVDKYGISLEHIESLF